MISVTAPHKDRSTSVFDSGLPCERGNVAYPTVSEINMHWEAESQLQTGFKSPDLLSVVNSDWLQRGKVPSALCFVLHFQGKSSKGQQSDYSIRWTINISSVLAGGLSTWQDNLHECKSPNLLLACVFQWAASKHGSMSFSLLHLHGSCAWPWICSVGHIPNGCWYLKMSITWLRRSPIGIFQSSITHPTMKVPQSCRKCLLGSLQAPPMAVLYHPE